MLSLTIAGETTLIQDEQQADAMRTYWQAREAGDQTAALVSVKDEEEAAEAVALLAPATTAAGKLSLVAKERIEEQERQLVGSGFALPPPLFAPGTRVVELGDRNFRVEREQVEALPLFPMAAAALVERIRNERRSDITVKPEELWLQPDGRLCYADGASMNLEARPFQAFCQHLGFGAGAKYLAELCTPELRARNVNAQIKLRSSRPVVLRTRRNDGGRSAFAVVTPTYASVDANEVVTAAMPALADARVELLYEDARLTATALWMPEHVVDLAAGDVFRVGVRLECDDTGRGRIRVTAVVLRNLCLNLIIVAEGDVETTSQVHRGDRERIRAALPVAVEAARSKIGFFLDAWGHARTLKVEPLATFKRWVETREVVVPGERDGDAVVNALVDAWKQEPGDTLADAVNALTRAAHLVPTWNMSVREELERAAGRLVMAVR
ncbi:hypothetical protein EPO34_02630 [Patescibacteria group bacterium]|nr:MAG: hypothetical protein EPO34_02630 [Patescibacteria group bacterium]